MKKTVKTLVLFLITLLIGVGIGFEISEMILKNHFAKMQEFKRPEYFVKFYEDVINPDTNQKKVIEPILLKYHKRLDVFTTKGFKGFAGIMDSLKTELYASITSEQKKKLDEKFREMEKH
ncbi:MAG TPA: hypothetical protein VHO43_19595 [Ignavibacteriales bacterium]|nr:hypothetical protein [Ignavibacteriales bacterium]